MLKHKLLATGFGAAGIAAMAIGSHETIPPLSETAAITTEYNVQSDPIDYDLFGNLALNSIEVEVAEDNNPNRYDNRVHQTKKQLDVEPDVINTSETVHKEVAISPVHNTAIHEAELPDVELSAQPELIISEPVQVPQPEVEINQPVIETPPTKGGDNTETTPLPADTCETDNPSIGNLEFDHQSVLADIEAQLASESITDIVGVNEKLAMLGQLYGADISIIEAGNENTIDAVNYQPYFISGVAITEDLSIGAIKQGLSVVLDDMKDISPELFKLTSLDAIHFLGDISSADSQTLAGFVSSGRYMAMDISAHPGLFIHEFEHALANRLCGLNDFYLDEALSSQNTQEYVGLFSGKELEPKYFTATKEREFATYYGASNVAEDRAEMIQSLLTYRGLVRQEDPDFGSPFDKKQQILVNRIEAVAPGFRSFIEKRTEEIRSNEDFYLPVYKTPEQRDLEYRQIKQDIIKDGLLSGSDVLYYKNTLFVERDVTSGLWKVIVNPIMNVTSYQKGGNDSYYSFTSAVKQGDEFEVRTLTLSPDEESSIYTATGDTALIQQSSQNYENGILVSSDTQQPIGKYQEMTDAELQQYLGQNPAYQEYLPAIPSSGK